MRRVFWLVVVAWFSAAACSVNTEPSGAGSSSDSGASGGSGGGIDGGSGGSTCFPSQTQKFCGGTSCPEKTDPDHGCAGTSCSPCDLSHAVADCASDGSCAIQSCNPGFKDCDKDPSDGCEVNTDADPKNCGSCGHDCFKPGDTTNWVCNQGTCDVSNCPIGKEDCNHDSSDGCEVDLTSDPKNCGFCTNDCSTKVQHATVTCSSSTCDYSKCDAGWGDCDGDRSNGCETPTSSDASNCGTCGHVCKATNGLAACSGGSCTYTCDKTHADCDSSPSSCETDITKIDNCGGCGIVCGNQNATPTCSGGKCQEACKGSWGNCDGNAANGCEVDTNKSTSNCGTCGKVCSAPNATVQCTTGSCAVASCKSGYGDCDGQFSNGCEAQLNTTTNCGTCGTGCNPANATGSCSTGTCAISSCSSGYGNCDSNVGNGCETDLTKTTNHCGTCGTDCGQTVVNAGGASCVNSQCTYSSCKASFDECDSNMADGCESLKTNTNCGSCGTPCTPTNATGDCSSGSCQIGQCDQGFDDCNHDPTDGCEVDLTAAHDKDCGSCGNDCKGGQHCSCSAGTCGCQ